jgi:hypothetical protein
MLETLLAVLSILALVGGLFFLSDDTMGIGIIGIAIFFAIFGRIVQADRQHKEIKRLLGEEQKPDVKSPDRHELRRMVEERQKDKKDS